MAAQQTEQRTRVGVGVMVLKGGKVLLSRRRGSHGAGEFSFPGGHLEYLEAFADCARREVREECGIAITNIRFLFAANIVRYAPRHYVHIGLVADWESGEPVVMEQEKSESWGWYDFHDPPEPLFLPCVLAFRCYLTGGQYLDIADV
ncbi:MAG: NUDIX domain-containing protein [bacterium]|nr:NUDIX domain-containing protein [bacterium]